MDKMDNTETIYTNLHAKIINIHQFQFYPPPILTHVNAFKRNHAIAIKGFAHYGYWRWQWLGG